MPPAPFCFSYLWDRFPLFFFAKLACNCNPLDLCSWVSGITDVSHYAQL
jgi:hypothetical protein